MATAGVTIINTSGMEKMLRSVDMAMQSPAPSPIRNAFKKWAFRYRSFSQERYDRLSKSGWNGKSLKPATIAARRHGRGGRYQRGGKALLKAKSSGGGSVSILRDTNTLFTALSPVFMNAPGQFERDINRGIEVGYGGPASHPEGKMTVARLAQIHNEGLGHQKERKIIVDPPEPLKVIMAGDMDVAMIEVVRDSQIRVA